jgi:fluoride exporter
LPAEQRRVNQWLAVGAVAVGGALGSVFRFLVGVWFLARLGPGFPWGTLAVNVSGAFLIGIVMHLAQSRLGLNPYARLFFATGILGGYTTFSAFAYETYALGRDGLATQSLVYGFGSVVVGVAAALLGFLAARAVFP